MGLPFQFNICLGEDPQINFLLCNYVAHLRIETCTETQGHYLAHSRMYVSCYPL